MSKEHYCYKIYVTDKKQCLLPLSRDNFPYMDPPPFLHNDLELSHSIIF